MTRRVLPNTSMFAKHMNYLLPSISFNFKRNFSNAAFGCTARISSISSEPGLYYLLDYHSPQRQFAWLCPQIAPPRPVQGRCPLTVPTTPIVKLRLHYLLGYGVPAILTAATAVAEILLPQCSPYRYMIVARLCTNPLSLILQAALR